MKTSKIPFNTVKSKRIVSVVDQTENPEESTTRSIYRSTDGLYFEVNYIFRGILLNNTVIKKIEESEFDEWKKKYLPENQSYLPIYEGQPNSENISFSLYKSLDGRYFEINRKISLGDGSCKENIVWLSPKKIDVWKALHTNLPHRDPANE